MMPPFSPIIFLQKNIVNSPAPPGPTGDEVLFNNGQNVQYNNSSAIEYNV